MCADPAGDVVIEYEQWVILLVGWPIVWAAGASATSSVVGAKPASVSRRATRNSLMSSYVERDRASAPRDSGIADGLP
jgi:hypothetical protein